MRRLSLGRPSGSPISPAKIPLGTGPLVLIRLPVAGPKGKTPGATNNLGMKAGLTGKADRLTWEGPLAVTSCAACVWQIPAVNVWAGIFAVVCKSGLT